MDNQREKYNKNLLLLLIMNLLIKKYWMKKKNLRNELLGFKRN